MIGGGTFNLNPLTCNDDDAQIHGKHGEENIWDDVQQTACLNTTLDMNMVNHSVTGTPFKIRLRITNKAQ